MKKGLLFVGLIIAMTLLCCYALVAADAVNKKIDNVTVKKNATVVQKTNVGENAAAMLSNHAALPLNTPVVAPLRDGSASLTETSELDPRIVELLETIDYLKSQGLYDPDIWNELYSLITPVHRPNRHFDQGGENCAAATAVTEPLPYTDTGTTVGYADDYEETGIFSCPYASTSPDVVYKYTPSADITVDIDLCNSSYDTKVFVYEEVSPSSDCGSLNAIACDDDGCGSAAGYTSIIEGLDLSAGYDYYIVIDGYGGGEGNYDLTIREGEAPPPPLECPANTLFGQPVHMPNDGWSAGTSEDSLGLLRYESFSGVTGEICDIHFWGLPIVLSGDWVPCNEDPMPFEIKFYQDSAGMPGAEVCTYVLMLNKQATGLFYHSTYQFPLYYWSATLDPCCAITDGWVSIQGMGDPDCWFLWMSSGTGDGSSLFDNNGVWESYAYDNSLCLTGEGGGLYGACCDPATGVCYDDVLSTECLPPHIFYANTLCADIDPPCGMGACCDLLTGGCSVTSYADCQGNYQEWHPGVDCDPNPCPPPGCVVECPAGGIAEGEPCPNDPDNYNGGCNSNPNIFQDVACGDVICGTSYADGTTRDTDWFRFTLTTPAIIHAWGVAEFDLQLYLVDHGDCSVPSVIVGASALVCDTARFNSDYMPAGEYTLWVGPTSWNDVWPCSDYVVGFTCEEPCDIVNYCENPIVTGPGTEGPAGTWTFGPHTENSCCATDPVPFVWSDMCGGSDFTSGPDIVYQFTLETENTLHIVASGPCDNQVMVFTSCDDPTGTCVASADLTFTGEDEVIDVTLPGGTYYVSTSCYSSSCDDITLTITSDCPLPVELTTFEAIAGNRQVTLNWTTASETNNDHFDVQRSANSEWITVGTVQGTNEVTGSNYQYVDRAVVNGVNYSYRLRSYDINGAVHEYDLTAEATPKAPVPVEYALDQNFPNPFNPNTTISYALKDAGFVTLKVYNLLGQEVATLVQTQLTAGRYTATFTAADLPSGVYIYRLEVNDFVATKKMVLMK